MHTSYRAFTFVLCLVAGRSACAIVPVEFALLGDGTAVVWSLTPLDKGDVLEVHAFKAEPGTTVVLALCNDRCDDAHVVKSISVHQTPTGSFTEKYALQESGHLVFWTVQPPRPELNAGASKAISEDSRNQVAGAIHSGFSGLYNGAEILRMTKSEFDAGQVKVRFDAGRYVTVKLIGAASQTNSSTERP